MRGFDARQVPLFIDGIPVYVPYDGYVDFDRFTTADLAAIQVAKGFSSVAYGPNALGGAINLISRKPTREIEGDVSLGFGDGNERTASANVGSNQGLWYVQAGASWIDSDEFRLSSDFEPTPTEDGGGRENSYRTDDKLSLKLGLTPNATDEYALSYYRQEGEKGQPPSTDPSGRALLAVALLGQGEPLLHLQHRARRERIGEAAALSRRLRQRGRVLYRRQLLQAQDLGQGQRRRGRQERLQRPHPRRLGGAALDPSQPSGHRAQRPAQAGRAQGRRHPQAHRALRGHPDLGRARRQRQPRQGSDPLARSRLERAAGRYRLQVQRSGARAGRPVRHQWSGGAVLGSRPGRAALCHGRHQEPLPDAQGPLLAAPRHRHPQSRSGDRAVHQL